MKSLFALIIVLIGCQQDQPRKPASECFPSWDTMVSFKRHDSFSSSLKKTNHLIKKLNDCFEEDIKKLSEKMIITAIEKCYPFLPKTSHRYLSQSLQRAKWMIDGHFDVRMVEDHPHLNLYFKDKERGKDRWCPILLNGRMYYDPTDWCHKDNCTEENFFASDVEQKLNKIKVDATPFMINGKHRSYFLRIKGELDDIAIYFSSGQKIDEVKNRAFEMLRDYAFVDIIELLPKIPREKLYKTSGPNGPNAHSTTRHFYKLEQWHNPIIQENNQLQILSGMIQQHYCLVTRGKAKFGDILISYDKDHSARYLIDDYVYTKKVDTPWMILKTGKAFEINTRKKRKQMLDIYRRCR